MDHTWPIIIVSAVGAIALMLVAVIVTRCIIRKVRKSKQEKAKSYAEALRLQGHDEGSDPEGEFIDVEDDENEKENTDETKANPNSFVQVEEAPAEGENEVVNDAMY